MNEGIRWIILIISLICLIYQATGHHIMFEIMPCEHVEIGNKYVDGKWVEKCKKCGKLFKGS
ncbi:MAG: hypothetical protein GQ474_08010 [Sulfurimonas sp.]|nr:hypothetical protein [Sulfurimonas sp.]